MTNKASSQPVSDESPQSASKSSGAASLDQLLSQNRALFDKLFDSQMAAAPPPIAPAAARREPDSATTNTDTDHTNASKQSDHIVAATDKPDRVEGTDTAQPGDITAELNRRFTITWSSEILEHRVDNERAVVSCRLTVAEDSFIASGSSRIFDDGDEQAALNRARDQALKKCADHFRPGPKPLIAPERTRHAGAGAASSGAATTAGPLDAMRVEQLNVALTNCRREMSTVFGYGRVLQNEHDHPGETSFLTDVRGHMLSGESGSFLAHLLETLNEDLGAGDVMLVSDPYACGGAVSHLNQWLVFMPVFAGDDPIGYVGLIGKITDAGGPTEGSAPATAQSILGEGVRVAPLKIVKAGMLDETALKLILANSRTPDNNRINLLALIKACKAGASQFRRLRHRFGAGLFEQASAALLDRSHQLMRELIVSGLAQEPQSFEDQIDDDGCGGGPFRLKVSVWREGEHAYIDWTGTDPQANGPINFKLPIGLAKALVGQHLAQPGLRSMLSNDGYYDLVHVTVPAGTLLNPDYPAPLGRHDSTARRHREMLTHAMNRHTPNHLSAASYGTHPAFSFVGTDQLGQTFQFSETLFGGIGAQRQSDGLHAQRWQPADMLTSIEQNESSYPIVIEQNTAIANTGGAGQYRGGNGFAKIYRFGVDGHISVHDDRHRSGPWGVLDGQAGSVSQRWLIRADGTRQDLPAKCDGIAVSAGDKVVFQTAGGGGYGDPLSRAQEQVEADVKRGLLTADGTAPYGLMLTGNGQQIDQQASEALRAAQKREQLT
ncbi:MAG: hydantoinase B/oxoprolinase family protein [Burkholderiaceae bacterium]